MTRAIQSLHWKKKTTITVSLYLLRICLPQYPAHVFFPALLCTRASRMSFYSCSDVCLIDADDTVPSRTFAKGEQMTDIPIQSMGVVDIDGSDILDSQLMAHALNNSASKSSLAKEQADFTIRRGSAFVNEYPRRDPETGERCDGGPSDPNHLLGSFPTLFPYGLGGFETKRTQDVPYEKHARWAMRYHDKRFRKDPQFPFQVFGVIQKREVCRKTDLQMNKKDYARSRDMLLTITPQDMLKASEEVSRKVRISNPAVRALRENVKAVRRKVRGTDESRQIVRSKIWGMTLSFNPPSIWLTINPSDTHDPIAQLFTGSEIDMDKFCDTAGPTSTERATNIAQDPYASAKFFHFIVTTVLEVLMKIKKTSNGRISRGKGIFGYVQGYIGTVEAQGRGALHLHMLIWLQDAPTSAEMHEKLGSEEFRAHISTYISKVVKADLNDMTTEDILQIPRDSGISYSRTIDPEYHTKAQTDELEGRLVRNLQYHNCSITTCLVMRRGKLVCKRKAPFQTSASDWVSEDGEWAPKRTCPKLNSWNTTVMFSLRANHDLKLLLNGRLTKKITYYIGNYASKKQDVSSNVTALLAKTLAFERKQRRRQTNLNEINKRMIMRCANSLSRYREFSAPEVMSYIMDWKDSYVSHTFVPIFLDAVCSALQKCFPSLRDERYAANAIHSIQRRYLT